MIKKQNKQNTLTHSKCSVNVSCPVSLLAKVYVKVMANAALSQTGTEAISQRRPGSRLPQQVSEQLSSGVSD